MLVRRVGDYDDRYSLRQWMSGVARRIAKRYREPDRVTADAAELSTLVQRLQELCRRREYTFELLPIGAE